ncbi:hypothetical protein GN958_ATG19912, partial [Phytophthora infestans]
DNLLHTGQSSFSSLLRQFMGSTKRKQRWQGDRGTIPKRWQPSRDPGIIVDTSTSLASNRAVFGATWRYLRGQGWYHRQPTGLSELYRCVPPNGNPRGVPGVDFFLGERALLEHYDRAMSCGNAGGDTETCNSDKRFGCSRNGDASSIAVSPQT